MSTPVTLQFGLRTLFSIVTLCGVTLAFMLARGAAAAVIALPLAAAAIAMWCCIRASCRAESWALRAWYLAGAGVSLALAMVAIGLTVAN